jgi:hypothetical protein
MEYLLIAVILYFIVQVTGNLVYLLRGQGSGAATDEQSSGRSSSRRPSPGQDESPRADPRYWGEDIEDATWHDLPD